MEPLDMVVIGAGPCGLAVGAAARESGMRAVLFDKGCITSSIVDYPYYMRFFSTADRLEIGRIPFAIPENQPSRREALVYYRRVVQHFGLDVRQYQEVEEVSGTAGSFSVKTRKRWGKEEVFEASAVVVATGGFHSPNLLHVPGEDLPKVFHYYREPYPFFDQDVLVVGGGNSAVEAALELFRAGARVSLVHFGDWLDKGVKPWVVPDISNRLERGEITVYWEHRVEEIRTEGVVLKDVTTDATLEIDNDWVLAMTGWKANPALLASFGVRVDPETGIPNHDPDTMETNVPGVFIAGVLAAGNNANKIFIENGRAHGGQIVRALRESAQG
ncbi:YpdA family putative bacillithiol disulfide reductase [Gemmatimonadota bacterium]